MDELKQINDELDDFELSEATPNYQVWILGRSKDQTVHEILIQDFDSIPEAKKCMSFFSELSIEELNICLGCNLPDSSELEYLELTLETVIPIDDSMDENIETIEVISLI
jgi:hypothetical protein